MLYGHEKVPFLNLPTPLTHLPALSQRLGVNFYIKRDDMTPLALGGNKLRKLEYLLRDAKEKGATTLLTMGGVQTNHGRLTAAVAAKYGLKCVILCIDEYPGEISANLLLDGLLDARVVLKKSDGRAESIQLEELAAKVRAEYEAQGDVVYEIPIGGSTAIGSLGYCECAMELTEQAADLKLGNARVVTAVGSIGTYMGLFYGLRENNSPLSLTGIAISPFDDNKKQRVLNYYQECKALFGLKKDAVAADFDIEYGYVREGYNKPNSIVRQAILEMARTEAILLDPCYTGKAFAGLRDMVEEGRIAKGETVIFLHTGGAPALYTPHHRREFEKELMEHVTVVE